MSSETFTGRVKWFNNKSGYGFITISEGDRQGTDVFVHHSSIHVETEQYRYLVQGEYVQFELSPTKNDKHEFQAINVTGLSGWKLMCESLRETGRQLRSVSTTKRNSVVRKPTPTSASTSTPAPRHKGVEVRTVDGKSKNTRR